MTKTTDEATMRAFMRMQEMKSQPEYEGQIKDYSKLFNLMCLVPETATKSEMSRAISDFLLQGEKLGFEKSVLCDVEDELLRHAPALLVFPEFLKDISRDMNAEDIAKALLTTENKEISREALRNALSSEYTQLQLAVLPKSDKIEKVAALVESPDYQLTDERYDALVSSVKSLQNEYIPVAEKEAKFGSQRDKAMHNVPVTDTASKKSGSKFSFSPKKLFKRAKDFVFDGIRSLGEILGLGNKESSKNGVHPTWEAKSKNVIAEQVAEIAASKIAAEDRLPSRPVPTPMDRPSEKPAPSAPVMEPVVHSMNKEGVLVRVDTKSGLPASHVGKPLPLTPPELAAIADLPPRREPPKPPVKVFEGEDRRGDAGRREVFDKVVKTAANVIGQPQASVSMVAELREKFRQGTSQSLKQEEGKALEKGKEKSVV